MILIAFRHGLRAAEVCDLRWDQVDLNGAVLHVRRIKKRHPPAPILCKVMTCGQCAAYNVRASRHLSFSSTSWVRRSRPLALPG
jgi:integrase